jgi:hypothetical protein
MSIYDGINAGSATKVAHYEPEKHWVTMYLGARALFSRDDDLYGCEI